jgi:DNA-binding transcriptional regulator YhcF (GntR family)
VKIWISKNSEVPVREQLVAQMTLGIASGDLKVGERLPSTREIARRAGVHANTVASAYQKLVDQSLIEFRKGSGFFVAESAGARIEGSRRLDELISAFLQSARDLGFEENDVIAQLKKGRRTFSPEGILVVESDAGLREILVYELTAAGLRTSGISLEDFSNGPSGHSRSIITAMFDEQPKLDAVLQNGQKCIYLKGGSVASAMSGEHRPAADELVAVVSGWDGFLTFARIMLLAAKIDPATIVMRSTSVDGWQDSIKKAALVICDTYTASLLDHTPSVRTFRVIADDSVAELASAIAKNASV